MTEASVLRLIRLLRRASVAAEPAVEALKLARLARRLAATDLATARIVAKRAERLMPRARRSVRDFVKESGVDAARGERVIVLLEREFEGARSVLKVESAMKRLASATLKDLSVDSVADEAALALREILAAEISPVYMNKLTDLLTREDWRRLVRRAAPLEPTALNTMRGLIQEAITLHLPQFQHAVREAEQLAKRLPGEWKPVISTQVMALDRAGRQLRAYVDKGVFAIHDGPPKLAVPLMRWQDKNVSNVGDLVRDGGQFGLDDMRLEGALLRLDGELYMVPQRLLKALPPVRYGAAPELPSTELLLQLKMSDVHFVVTPIPSDVIGDVGLRMIQLLKSGG